MRYTPIKDNVLLSVDATTNSKKMVGGVELEIVTKFDPYNHAAQNGVVCALPARLSKGRKNMLSVGDKVYCHHFLTEESNKVEVDGSFYYQISYDDIYCKITPEGDVVMIGDWNFCDAILEAEEGFDNVKDEQTGNVFKKSKSGIIVSTNVKTDTKWATMRHLSSDSLEAGINKGNRIVYRKDCDYEMTVEGKKYFRIKTKDILAIEYAN